LYPSVPFAVERDMFAKTGPVVPIDPGSAAVLNPNLAVGHGGGFSGISVDFLMCIDADHTMAVLSNYGGGAEPVSQKIQKLVGRKE
jgi:hypothetical protein